MYRTTIPEYVLWIIYSWVTEWRRAFNLNTNVITIQIFSRVIELEISFTFEYLIKLQY